MSLSKLGGRENPAGLLIAQIEKGKISAAHDISEGGLLVCLAEMLFDGDGLGASLSTSELGKSGRLDALLFGESQARAVIAVRQEDREDILQAAEQIGVPALCLGQTNQSDQLRLPSFRGNGLRYKSFRLEECMGKRDS